MKSRLFFLSIFICINLYSQGTYVFLGSFNRDKTQDGIYVYELDTVNGNLLPITSINNLSNPSFLTLSPNGKYLFACTESKTPHAGSVSSFEFKPENKTLTFINSQPSGGENPVYLTVHKEGKWLINGNYTEGSVSVYPISETGTIDSMVQNFQFLEGSIHPQRQDRSHIHATVFSPSFDYLFLPDLGADKIRSYEFNGEKEKPLALEEQQTIQTTPGSGPRHFTFSPNQQFAYCIEELSGTISVYSYENGKLDAIQRVKTHSKKQKQNFESSDLHISPDGKFLYASNRGFENSIAIFSIQNNGKLTPIGYQSTFGEHPRTFALDESGKFIIVTNVVSGNVVVFRRNNTTGLLTRVGTELNINNVSCVQIRAY